MAKKRIVQVDAETGEEIGSSMILVAQRVTSGFQKGRYMIMSQNALEAISMSNLGGKDLRVFMFLNARLDFENYIHLPQIEIAEKLNMQRSHVSRAMKHLIEADILIKGPKIGRSLTYRLNPNVGWKGTGFNHRKAIESNVIPLHK